MNKILLITLLILNFNFSKESVDKFTKVNEQNYTLVITSGTIELKDNKVIVLVD